MRHVTVGEDNLLNLQIVDQFYQFGFGVDRNTFGVQRTGQRSRVAAAFNIGDLRCSKSHNLVFLVIAEIHIEVVEIAPGGAHDESTDGHTAAPFVKYVGYAFTSLVGL